MENAIVQKMVDRLCQGIDQVIREFSEELKLERKVTTEKLKQQLEATVCEDELVTENMEYGLTDQDVQDHCSVGEIERKHQTFFSEEIYRKSEDNGDDAEITEEEDDDENLEQSLKNDITHDISILNPSNTYTTTIKQEVRDNGSVHQNSTISKAYTGMEGSFGKLYQGHLSHTHHIHVVSIEQLDQKRTQGFQICIVEVLPQGPTIITEKIIGVEFEWMIAWAWLDLQKIILGIVTLIFSCIVYTLILEVKDLYGGRFVIVFSVLKNKFC